MSLSPQTEQLVLANAQDANIQAAILRAMVEQESADNALAVRFEPDFYKRYLVGQDMNFVPSGCTVETERALRAVSWGLLQIMGETARCVGFRGWFPELTIPAVGLKWGCAYLRRLYEHYGSEGHVVVLRAYNGGPGNRHNASNTYPDEVIARIPGGLHGLV